MRRLICLALVLLTHGTLADEPAPLTLSAGSLSIRLDPAQPRILDYSWNGGTTVLEGQREPGTRMAVNGQAATGTTTLRRMDGRSAEYRIEFPAEQLAVRLRVQVDPEFVELRMAGVEERGTNRLRTLALPDTAWVTLRSAQSNAAVATVYATAFEPPTLQRMRERLGPLADQKPGEDTGNYFFGSAGGLAFGFGGNHIVDAERIAFRISDAAGARACAVRNPTWLFRGDDGEVLPEPWLRIFLTGDRNGDGLATWQDAALLYRAHMPKPYGSEYVRTTVGEQIAMNFASGAQQPFLRILDHVKKAALATDGLGQQVVIKGFSSEGHDSANTDYGGNYNERAGGLRDLVYLQAQARRYNARIGIHINASEVYPEARRYHPDLLRKTANGQLERGWQWLDQAIMIDKQADLRSGRLFAALEQMRREQPQLDFVYVDTYWTHGWTAWKLAEKLRALRLPMYTEGDAALDPWTTWAHWRGAPSAIMRFLWFSDRDLFNNDPLLRGGRADSDGCLGWQNQHRFGNFIQGTFGRHLPAKFLKHFDLLRWEPGRVAEFSGGVRVEKQGDQVTCSQSGRVVMTWTGGGEQQRLFVPWDPLRASKIYVWDEVGGSHTWDLPPAWRRRSEVVLYPLSDRGRGEPLRLPVQEGRVTITVPTRVPHVLYPQPASAQPALAWGEGGLVADPGFDSHSFSWWSLLPAVTNGVRVENDERGNTRLVVDGDAAVTVAQDLKGLAPGRRYAASVWVQVRGRQLAALEVKPLNVPGEASVSNFVTRTVVRHGMPNDPRTGTTYQRLKVDFTVPDGARTVRLALRVGAGSAGTAVEFDDVRVVRSDRSPAAAQHTFWEDFEHVDQGYGPFTCCFGERTHLAEANPPHTQDTINGRYSLKTREGKGLVARTLPATLRLKPFTRYRLVCQTLTAPGGSGRLVVMSQGRPVFDQPIVAGRGEVRGEFATGRDEESFLAWYKDAGDWVTLDDLALDELGPAPQAELPALVDDLVGRPVLLDERFAAELSPAWKVIASPAAGTRVIAAGGVLTIEAAANTSALIERVLPDQVEVVECRLEGDGDAGQTWGPGLTLVWPGGAAVRLNLRGPDGRFAVDAQPGGQRISQTPLPGGVTTLRIRLEGERVILETRGEDAITWSEAGTLPRAAFAGAPQRIRVGKMHGVEGTDDHTAAGSPAVVEVFSVRAWGPLAAPTNRKPERSE